jgi:hypothetical protein
MQTNLLISGRDMLHCKDDAEFADRVRILNKQLKNRLDNLEALTLSPRPIISP